MQASAQECQHAWPGSSANIRQGKRENVAQLARIAAADSTQAADLLEALRLALRRRIVGECVKCSGWPVMVETLAAFVVCSRCVGCVERLRKLAARCSVWPAVDRRCVWECMQLAFTGGFAVGLHVCERFRYWRGLQALADGMRVGCNPSRVNHASVAASAVCVQDNK